MGRDVHREMSDGEEATKVGWLDGMDSDDEHCDLAEIGLQQHLQPTLFWSMPGGIVCAQQQTMWVKWVQGRQMGQGQ